METNGLIGRSLGLSTSDSNNTFKTNVPIVQKSDDWFLYNENVDIKNVKPEASVII